MTKAAEMATEWWASRLQSGDVEAFKASLLPLIEEDLAKYGLCRLECDYDPFEHLLTAVRAAGLNCRGCLDSAKGILPMKHTLWVYPDVLKPKEGYGNWTTPIKVEE